jgi:nitroreductase
MIQVKHIKIAETKYPLADFISQRWSPRAFADKAISTDALETILEAASWSYSANYAQPWEYYFAHHGDAGFDKLVACLMPGNQAWAKNAAVLLVAVAKKKFENDSLNPFSKHDLGAANANLTAQAFTMGIYTHVMGGFDSQKVITELQLNTDEKEPVVCIAMGYRGEAELLEEPFLARELSPRSRRPLSEILKQIQ